MYGFFIYTDRGILLLMIFTLCVFYYLQLIPDAYDIQFWYNYGPGSPVGAAQGAAYANELLARLKNVPLTSNPFGANQTLDGDNATFPLGQSIYSDATHDVVVTNILTALNFSVLAEGGPLPLDHIPKDRSFITSRIAPFGTNFVCVLSMLLLTMTLNHLILLPFLSVSHLYRQTAPRCSTAPTTAPLSDSF